MHSHEHGSAKLRTLKLSTVAIGSVVAVELLLGGLVGSLAIMSDGLHALLDTITTFVLFVATREAMKPPDEEHMYGHERFESIGGMAGGIALIGTSLLIMYEAIVRFIGERHPNLGLEYVGFIAIGFTFAIDFFRVGTFLRSRKSESATLKAGLYHAVADLGSTIIALLGFGLSALGIFYGDSIASMVLSVMLAYLSIRLVWSSGRELSDAISHDLADRIRNIVIKTKGVDKYKNLRVRKAGEKTYVEATIQVPDYMTLEEGHTLASRIESNIRQSIRNAEVLIHVEPPPETEAGTKQLVERLVEEIEGVKEPHDIMAVHEGDRLYITLHAYVDSATTLKDAHIKADEIETRIRNNIKGAENVTVHLEPFGERKHIGPALNEEELRKAIAKLTQSVTESFRASRIITYIAQGKRYVVIHCVFGKQVSLEEAHEIASQIEETIQRRFADTIVTVHMEPEEN